MRKQTRPTMIGFTKFHKKLRDTYLSEIDNMRKEGKIVKYDYENNAIYVRNPRSVARAKKAVKPVVGTTAKRVFVGAKRAYYGFQSFWLSLDRVMTKWHPLWKRRVIAFELIILFIAYLMIDSDSHDRMLELDRNFYVRPTIVAESPIVAHASGPSESAVEQSSLTFNSEGEPKVIAEGKVSYYSLDGCLGCGKHYDKDGSVYFVMANGERFDDRDMILAVPAEWRRTGKVKLNSERCPECGLVRVTNLDNGKRAVARITDTGGFAKYGRIADLSKALYEHLEAKTDKSKIRIEELPVMEKL